MSELDRVKKALIEIGKEDYYDDVKEVFELSRVLKDRINKIDDFEIRWAAFFAVITGLTHDVKIPFAVLISMLEAVKFQHLLKDAFSDLPYLRMILGEREE